MMSPCALGSYVQCMFLCVVKILTSYYMTGYCQTEGGATSIGEGRVSKGEGEEEEKQVCLLQSYT